MASPENAEEVRYIKAMGQELGEIFHAASSELTWIHWRWRQYRILFGEKPSRLDLVNEAAPFFFFVVHQVFFQDTLLAIARLVGPSESLGKPNLSIERFRPLLPSNPQLRDEVSKLIDSAKESATFALEWRNKHLAHRDLDLVLQRGQALLPATRGKVEESLSALRDVLNRIELEFCSSHTAYDSSRVLGDAKDLLYIIREGLRCRHERAAALKRGELSSTDWAEPI
ncbi:MAG: hypothetical protein ACRD4S_11440 [Candidatus Acidiferrales bacterium]